MSAIDEFLSRYRKEFDFYDEAGRISAQLLGSRLQASGVRSIVTSRAKSVSRLGDKLRQRMDEKNYQTADDIYKDIVDLAGVRVALYFPGQRSEVEAHIHQIFTSVDRRDFPNAALQPKYQKRFSGYWATHYRAQLRESLLNDAQMRYAEAKIEIQVASVLMHAWSEVEHDLVYKPLQGTLSDEEFSVLDELNGLVMAGEIALERLQRAGQARVSSAKNRFANHYELAAFLLASSQSPKLSADSGLGRVDLLFELLRGLDLAAPDSITPYLSAIDGDTEKRPLSEQVIDQLLAEDASRYAVFNEIKDSRHGKGPENTSGNSSDGMHSALGFFMTQWIAFERAVRKRFFRNGDAERGPPVPSPSLLENRGIIDRGARERLEPIRRLRNDVVHGVFAGEPAQLVEAGESLRSITEKITS